jgi:tetratricopeptide (TPR) repeat protein
VPPPLAVDPFSEAATRDLMRRLAAAGERGGAIAAYRRLAERLSSQLRIAPGAATRALAEELLATNAAPDDEVDPASPDTGSELAISHYQQALERAADTNQDEARRAELLIGLGEAQTRAGRAGEAKKAFEEAAAIATRLRDPQVLARATLGIAGIGVTILDLDETLAARLEEALKALRETDFGMQAELLARLAIARAYSPDRGESGRVAEHAVELARRHGDPATLARALCAQHVSLGAPEHLEQRLQTANEMLELAERAGGPREHVASQKLSGDRHARARRHGRL